MDWPHPCRSRDGDAGVHRPRSRRLGSGAADGPSGRGPSALPRNILAKIADVRSAGKGGSVEKLQDTIEDIKTDLGKSEVPRGTISRPVVVTSEQVAGFSGFTWLSPIVGPLGTAGLVLAMVIFMLLERRDLRDRLIGLLGARPSRHHDEGV